MFIREMQQDSSLLGAHMEGKAAPHSAVGCTVHGQYPHWHSGQCRKHKGSQRLASSEQGQCSQTMAFFLAVDPSRSSLTDALTCPVKSESPARAPGDVSEPTPIEGLPGTGAPRPQPLLRSAMAPPTSQAHPALCPHFEKEP